MADKKRVSVVAAVESDLADIKRRSPTVAQSALAASALALARELDDDSNSATSKSMCARALADILEQLRALAPPKDDRDGLDEIADARKKRLAGRAAS